MTYEEFCSVLLQKLESRKDELGYVKVRYYPDGFTSEDQEELMTIRDTNIRYNKTESDVLSGDFVILYVEAVSAHILNPMDTYKPPYHKGAFMALNSDVKPLSAMAVPTVTTTTQMNGAIAMFYPGVRERIAELFGGDYYVAFTSIHEGRLHKKGTISPREILGRIKEMNRMLDSWEVLTRKVYLYEAASKEFKQLEL